MNLFEHRRQRRVEAEAPLAARMRPRTLDEFVGQGGIVGPGRLLRRAIQADQLSSLIFYGPPGTGKTTLARIIANHTAAEFIALNAVLSGVKDIRESIKRAHQIRAEHDRRTILFVDEVHRFNKSQQDALLPHVENGTVIFIGATTENPYFEVNKALVSRSRLFQLQSLTNDDLRSVVSRALTTPERGFGELPVTIETDALDHLVDVSNGDARALLNALELAVTTTEPSDDGAIVITLQVAEESIQQRAVLYDKEGDIHFDAISAFIKSVRGSDPDAALYWMARMIYAGEDPRYLFRRMIILASEDIGLADPDALVRVEACAAAFDRVGLPEGRYHLSQAVLVLSTAPKSNSTMGFFEALKTVSEERDGEVPNHLKDPNRDKEGFGHGAGYLYPHAYRDHWVAQQYLPSGLVGQSFYKPSDQGYEAQIGDQVARRREAQVAAVREFEAAPEGLTTGPVNAGLDRWVHRAASGAGERLASLRAGIFERAEIARHHLVLDVRVRSGLLTWEALRKAPEGGVYACVSEAEPGEAMRLRAALEAQIAGLPPLHRPTLITSAIEVLPKVMADQEAGVRFERVIGRDVFTEGPTAEAAQALADVMSPGGRLVLAEMIPQKTQRLHALAPLIGLDPALAEAWASAEEAVYAEDTPRLRWGTAGLQHILTEAGFEASVIPATTVMTLQGTSGLVSRWWADSPGGYRQRLAAHFDPDLLAAGALDTLARWARGRWANQSLSWHTEVAWVVATR
ncbi:MAG: AAA family ATPase [Bradymonadia bacterium]